jgi:exodeoxyribonuclease V alpha subunit
MTMVTRTTTTPLAWSDWATEHDALTSWAELLGAAAAHGAAALTDGAPQPVALAAALALWAPQHGHACIDVTTVAADVAAETAAAAGTSGNSGPIADVAALPWPEPDSWLDALRSSPLVRVVPVDPDGPRLDDRPLVLRDTMLYTQRQWIDTLIVADGLHTLARDGRLAVIVGGPGTGKTHTAGRLIADLPAADTGLAAPTGKAAARLTESVGSAAAELGAPPRQAVTLHRLLGPRPDHRTRFVHHAGNPLPYRTVLVDETSMVPLPMMARLVEALPADGSLVLVGDPDQLESVEVGAVLGDIVRAAAPGSPLAASLTRLTTQHRTTAGSYVDPLATAVRDADADAAIALLRAGHELLTWVEIADGDLPGAAAVDTVRAAVAEPYRRGLDAARAGHDAAALAAFATTRILCGHRRGPFGVETWNRHVESWLLDRPMHDYPGRLLLATRNDLRTGIVNGDTGVLVARPGGGSPLAVFGGVAAHRLDLAQLDEVETAFAMTVHKSQGSEYDTVVLVHPPAESPLVGRELLYTAITRARRGLVVVASEDSIRQAIATPTRRATGLTDLLLSRPLVD